MPPREEGGLYSGIKRRSEKGFRWAWDCQGGDGSSESAVAEALAWKKELITRIAKEP